MKKILLADYDVNHLAYLKALLEKSGYAVEVAHNGSEAIERYLDGDHDLVIMEPMLPKIHGFEVSKKIKTSPRGGEVKIIWCTKTYRGKKYRDEAFYKYKIFEHLERPVKDDVILDAVRRAIGEGGGEGAVASDASSSALDQTNPSISLKDLEGAKADAPSASETIFIDRASLLKEMRETATMDDVSEEPTKIAPEEIITEKIVTQEPEKTEDLDKAKADIKRTLKSLKKAPKRKTFDEYGLKKTAPVSRPTSGKLFTSKDIFGDILGEETPPEIAKEKPAETFSEIEEEISAETEELSSEEEIEELSLDDAEEEKPEIKGAEEKDPDLDIQLSSLEDVPDEEVRTPINGEATLKTSKEELIPSLETLDSMESMAEGEDLLDAKEGKSEAKADTEEEEEEEIEPLAPDEQIDELFTEEKPSAEAPDLQSLDDLEGFVEGDSLPDEQIIAEPPTEDEETLFDESPADIESEEKPETAIAESKDEEYILDKSPLTLDREPKEAEKSDDEFVFPDEDALEIEPEKEAEEEPETKEEYEPTEPEPSVADEEEFNAEKLNLETETADEPSLEDDLTEVPELAGEEEIADEKAEIADAERESELFGAETEEKAKIEYQGEASVEDDGAPTIGETPTEELDEKPVPDDEESMEGIVRIGDDAEAEEGLPSEEDEIKKSEEEKEIKKEESAEVDIEKAILGGFVEEEKAKEEPTESWTADEEIPPTAEIKEPAKILTETKVETETKGKEDEATPSLHKTGPHEISAVSPARPSAAVQTRPQPTAERKGALGGIIKYAVAVAALAAIGYFAYLNREFLMTQGEGMFDKIKSFISESRGESGEPSQQQAPIKDLTGMTKPKIKNSPYPELPPGTTVPRGTQVFVSVVISEEGRALEARTAHNPTDDPTIARAAEEAVRKWTFTPAEKDGVPQKVEITVPVGFASPEE